MVDEVIASVRGEAIPETDEAGELTLLKDDLNGVVTKLRPFRTRHSDLRDPNIDKVRWFLEAGIELLLSSYTLLQSQQSMSFRSANELFKTITEDKLVAQYAEVAKANGVQVSKAKKPPRALREPYWDQHHEYQADLLSYLFRSYFHDSRMLALRREVRTLTDISFNELVDWLAVAESDEVTSVPEVRLQLAVQTAFPADDRVRALAKGLYDRQRDAWAVLYEQIAATYGITLDPAAAIDWDDVATIFNLVVEGASLRRAVSPELGLLVDSSHAAVRIIQMLLSQMVGRPWSELAELHADLSNIPLS